jgi:hypothetical protein
VKATGLGLWVVWVCVGILDAGCWVLVESVMASGSSGRWAWFMGRGRLLTKKIPALWISVVTLVCTPLLPGSLLYLLSTDGTDADGTDGTARSSSTEGGRDVSRRHHPLPSCAVDLASDLKV